MKHARLAILITLGLLSQSGVSFAQVNQKERTEAEAFATKAIWEIGNGWSAKAFDRFTNSAYKKENPSVAQRRFEGILRGKLGSLKSVEPWKPGTWKSDGSAKNSEMSLSLKASAEFQRGPGAINLLLSKSNGQWGLSGFRVSSSAFLK
jgi:hypothetical protein